ncbi:TRAP transporter substrate-binding protein [bacterium]|nr:TRAP transporter substrate-binding protein [bacterium]
MDPIRLLKVTACASLLFLATMILGQPLTAETYKAQVSSQMPVKHPITTAMDLFVKTANENSNGRLELSHFSSGQLLNDKEVPNAINKGTIQLAQTFFVWWSGKVPELYPYGGKQPLTFDHTMRFFRGPLDNHFKETLAKANAAGKTDAKLIAPILYGFNGGYILNKPVKGFGDMKGFKIRIPTRILAAEVTALDGVPTVMSSADVYMSLQRNTIQGAMAGLTTFYARKWYEGAKYIFVLRPLPTDFHIVANLTWFNSLPADLQQVIMDAGKVATEASTKMVIAMEDEIESMLKAKGVEIYRVSTEDYQKNYAPVVELALRNAAIKSSGQELTDKWDSWVDATR